MITGIHFTCQRLFNVGADWCTFLSSNLHLSTDHDIKVERQSSIATCRSSSPCVTKDDSNHRGKWNLQELIRELKRCPATELQSETCKGHVYFTDIWWRGRRLLTSSQYRKCEKLPATDIINLQWLLNPEVVNEVENVFDFIFSEYTGKRLLLLFYFLTHGQNVPQIWADIRKKMLKKRTELLCCDHCCVLDVPPAWDKTGSPQQGALQLWKLILQFLRTERLVVVVFSRGT